MITLAELYRLAFVLVAVLGIVLALSACARPEPQRNVWRELIDEGVIP